MVCSGVVFQGVVVKMKAFSNYSFFFYKSAMIVLSFLYTFCAGKWSINPALVRESCGAFMCVRRYLAGHHKLVLPTDFKIMPASSATRA